MQIWKTDDILCLGRGAEIQFDGIRAYIRLDPSHVNNTRGLCGTFDFNRDNDFSTRAQIVDTNTQTFVDEYKTNSACTTPSQDNPCTINGNVRIIESFLFGSNIPVIMMSF